MGSITVYKVKDLDSGLFMNKSCGWDKKGKTWESLGKLRLTLSNHGYLAKKDNGTESFGDDIKIIAIKIVETEDNTSSLDEFVNRQRRYIQLGDKFGDSFKDLVERIESQGQKDQFQWVLAANGSYDWNARVITGDFAELLDIVKDMKLKQNKDYKKSSNYHSGGCIAFASKEDAMRVRLRMQGQTKGINIKDYIETELD